MAENADLDYVEKLRVMDSKKAARAAENLHYIGISGAVVGRKHKVFEDDDNGFPSNNLVNCSALTEEEGTRLEAAEKAKVRSYEELAATQEREKKLRTVHHAMEFRKLACVKGAKREIVKTESGKSMFKFMRKRAK